MNQDASFWNKIVMPSFIDVIWSKITDWLSASATSGSPLSPPLPRKLQMQQKPAPIPNCHLATSKQQLIEFCDFLRQFFNTSTIQGGAIPISILTPASASAKKLRPIILRLPNQTIGGVVSSQPIGNISNLPMRLISNFCVHPNYRKQGLGSQLLNAIWHDIFQLGEDACIFLKEGQPILTAGPPLMSGRWIYRFCQAADNCNGSAACRQIPAADVAADALITSYASASNNVLFNTGIFTDTCKTILYEYKGLRGSILAAFTPADQIHSLNRRPIYYQTGWLERGDILLTERAVAARAISTCIGNTVNGAWVWCDISVINSAVAAPWKLDGPYYYYAFQWTANLYGSAKLFLRL